MSQKSKPARLRINQYAPVIICAIMFCVSSACAAQQPSSSDPIVVNGDTVEYLQEKKQVVGTGNVSITYKDVILNCDKITVNLETRDAEAIGHVRIRQKGTYFTGDKIAYNFDSRKGEVTNGYINASPFFGRAKDLGKTADKDEYVMNKGYITTCDYDTPHYRIEAKQVRIYINDKIVAKHIKFYIGNVPVLWLPYWSQPLDKERKSHISVIPGQSKDWGYYVLTAYRYNLNDRSKGDILLDYRSKKGLGVGVNHYINTREVGKGAFKYYYTHENDALAYDPSGAVRSRYRMQYRHRWDMKDLDTTAIVEINKISDTDIIKDYFYNEYQELGDKPDNYISVVTAKKDYSTEFLIRFAPNKFYQVIERLPQYKIDILNYKIGNTNFYYNGNTSAAYLNMTYDGAYPKPKDVGAVRVDSYNEISYSAKLFKALSVRPYAGIRETYYSRNKWGDTNLTRTIFTEGIQNSVKFYKVYNVESNFMGLDIHKLRHIITPSVNYYHTHQPTISPDNLTQYDEIDALDTDNGMQFAIENKLQTKRGTGDQMQSVDLATFIVSTDYKFRLNKDSLDLKSNKFQDLKFRLELIPYNWLYVTSDMTVNTKNSLVETGNVDFVANGGDKWTASAGLRYRDDSMGQSNQITTDVTYKFNEKWKIRAYERFDTATKKWEEQQYTISRDLHCWIAEMTLSLGDARNTSLWFVMKLKAFPDYPIGYKQTYSRPRFGQAGASQ